MSNCARVCQRGWVVKQKITQSVAAQSDCGETWPPAPESPRPWTRRKAPCPAQKVSIDAPLSVASRSPEKRGHSEDSGTHYKRFVLIDLWVFAYEEEEND